MNTKEYLLAARPHVERGETFARRGDAEAAVMAFELALTIDPASNWIAARRAGAQLLLAAAKQRKKTRHVLEKSILDSRFLPILTALRKASTTAPNDRWIQCQIIESLRCLKYINECRDECTALIAHMPESAWAYTRRSWTHRSNLDFDQALRDIRIARRLRPSDPMTKGFEAVLLGMMGQVDSSTDMFDSLVNEDSRDLSRWSLERSFVLIHARRYSDALHWLELSTRRPDAYLAHYLIAVLRVSLHGREESTAPLARAQHVAEKVMKGDGGAMGRYMAGGLAVLSGHSQRALPVLRDVLGLNIMFVELALLDPAIRPLCGSNAALADIIAQKLPKNHAAFEYLRAGELVT